MSTHGDFLKECLDCLGEPARLEDAVKKLLYAGVGAVSLTKERGEKLLGELVRRGELTVEQGKVLNEELKRNVKEAIKENVDIQIETVTDDAEANDNSVDDSDWLKAVDSLSDADFEALKQRIARREAADQEQEDMTDDGEA